MVCVKALPSQRSGSSCAKALQKDFLKSFSFQWKGVLFFFSPGAMVHYDIDDQRRAGCLRRGKQVLVSLIM